MKFVQVVMPFFAVQVECDTSVPPGNLDRAVTTLTTAWQWRSPSSGLSLCTHMVGLYSFVGVKSFEQTFLKLTPWIRGVLLSVPHAQHYWELFKHACKQSRNMFKTAFLHRSKSFPTGRFSPSTWIFFPYICPESVVVLHWPCVIICLCMWPCGATTLSHWLPGFV